MQLVQLAFLKPANEVGNSSKASERKIKDREGFYAFHKDLGLFHTVTLSQMWSKN